MTDLPALIQTACEIKEQMHAQIITLYARYGTPEWFEQEHRHVARVLTRQYAPALRAIVDATTEADLTARRDRLDDRLDQGFDWCSAHPDRGDAQSEWCRMLIEYEVISDALNHIGVINGTLDRIDWIAALQPPEGIVHV